MTSARHTAALAICLLAAGACRRGPDDLATVDSSVVAVARATRLQRELASNDPTWQTTPLARWVLPRELREISGLTLSKDGRLLAQTD